MTSPIPIAALDDRLGFVGTAGSGKTYNAMAAVERLMANGARVVIPDPLGVWWGLRLLPDGKTASPFRPVIFGGPHGDLPINEHAGALIGETVAGMAESAIIDLADFPTKAAERRFMLAFLTALYRHTSSDPLHVIFDEADMWAPERMLDKDGDAAKLKGMMETIVRRGRVKGFIPWLITQRPAVISKDVLSQVDGLVSFKLTSSQDRNALGAWVEGQADKAEWSRLYGELATLPRGTGLVWLPARGVLTQAAFPPKATFDSSRTPKRGEKRSSAKLQPIDIGALKGRLATIEAEVRENDPKALKARIRELERERAAERAHPLLDATAVEAARQQGYEAGHGDGYGEAASRLGAILGEASGRLRQLADEIAATKMPPPRAGVVQSVEHRPSKPKMTGSTPAARSTTADHQAKGSGAELRPLRVLAARHPARLTEAQWATLAGMKRTGGTWNTYKSRLRTAGYIEQDGSLFGVTPGGMEACGETPPSARTPDELIDMWARAVGGAGKLLHHLAAIYPAGLSRQSLAEQLGLAASGGTFNTYLSRLRSNGLIDEADGIVSASEALFS